jgi:Tol biopolymer transport system component
MRPLPFIVASPLLAAMIVPAVGAAAVRADHQAPRNGRIAYSTGAILPDPDTQGRSQVFTVRPDGSGRRQLTHVSAPVQAGDPNYSPGGRRIVYVSNATGRFQVWVMSASGAHQHRLVVDPRRNAFLPSWAPDGKHIVFTRCHKPFGFLECSLATVRANGSQLRVVARGHWVHFVARYAPDGRKLAFSTSRAGYTSAIWTARPDGSAARRLTRPGPEAFWPDYAPDGQRILFSNNADRPHSNLFTMRTDGSHVRQVSHITAPAQAAFGSYSPDGRRIVYDAAPTTDASPHEGLAVMNADGTHAHTIVQTGTLTIADWGVAR